MFGLRNKKEEIKFPTGDRVADILIQELGVFNFWEKSRQSGWRSFQVVYKLAHSEIDIVVLRTVRLNMDGTSTPIGMHVDIDGVPWDATTRCSKDKQDELCVAFRNCFNTLVDIERQEELDKISTLEQDFIRGMRGFHNETP